MKKLPIPVYQDIEHISQASENRRMGSYPYLKDQLDIVTLAYENYLQNSGNVLNISPATITQDLKNALRVHYSSEPDCFPCIPELRGSSRRVCPMCGSLGTGTLDHLLPKNGYPEFSVFSKNLVPACDCNNKRNETVYGVCSETGSPARVLHPYFDTLLSTRQIYFKISPNPEFPVAKFEIKYLNADQEYHPSLKFHVENVVLPSGILEEMIDMWTSLTEYPSDKIHTLPSNSTITLNGLIDALQDALSRHDRQKTTPNNWESIFIYSILQSNPAMTWIVQKHNAIINDL